VSEQQQETAHPNTVRVSAPARLHLGFLDLNGRSGRKFGSIGLAINTHQTTIEVSLSDQLTINGLDLSASTSKKVASIITQFYDTVGQHITDKNRGMTITFKDLIPEHSGLGSGTQLALCIGTALCKLHNISLSTPQLAAALGRGARSGIGITTFDRGGFVIDGGSNQHSEVPALLGHYTFPASWRMVLIMDQQHQGVHGSKEISAFKELPEFPLSQSQAICHLTLMKLLPALVEQDIDIFGEAVTEIQQLIGDHFAPAQGGRYASKQVGALLTHAQTLGHTGIAQSSWGPTACIFVESDAEAENLVQELVHHTQLLFDDDHQIAFYVAKANANGANIGMIS